jgi:hypothetical protein
MSHFGQIKEIVKKHKYKIAFTYMLLLAEYTIFALIPFFMGKAIDSLIKESFEDFYFYIFMSIAGMFIGTFRRRFDTRTFMKVWQEKTLSSISIMMERKIDPAKILSRSGMAQVYGTFLEHHLPLLIESIIDIIIGITMIWLVVPKTSYVVFSLVIFVIIMQCSFSQWIKKIEIDLQNMRELTNDAILKGDIELVDLNQAKMAKLHIKISDLEASCWRFAELLTIICEVFIVFALVNGSVTAGMILSTITYGKQVFMKTNFLTYIFGSIRQMQVFEEFMKNPD